MRSAPTITRLRERRSTSGAASRPIAIAGRKSASRSPAIHVPECVRSRTSRLSATKAPRDPWPRVRALLEVEVQGDEREPRTEARTERGEEEQAKRAPPAPQVLL